MFTGFVLSVYIMELFPPHSGDQALIFIFVYGFISWGKQSVVV